MPEPYAAIAQTDPAVQDLLAGILELRAADPRQRDMLASYTAELTLPPGSPRERSESGRFFGFGSYISAIAARR